MSNESAPRSSTNDALLSTWLSSTPSCSTIICFTFCSTDMTPPEFVNALILATFAQIPQVRFRMRKDAVCARLQWPKSTTHGATKPGGRLAFAFACNYLQMASHMHTEGQEVRGQTTMRRIRPVVFILLSASA